MQEFTIPSHLLAKIDAKHLQQFMRNEGFDHSQTKEALIYRLIESINAEDDEAEKEQLIASYHNFLLKTIKHNNNRKIVTYPIQTTQSSPYYSEKNILNKFDVPSIECLNFSKVISGEGLNKEKFTELFRHITVEDGLVELIEVCYGKINKEKRDDESEITTYEYVWCEIDPKEDVLRLILSTKRNEFTKNNNNKDRNKTQKLIKDKLNRDYNIIFLTLTEKQTLFKMYKYLTAHLEAPYEQKVNPYSKEIEDFTSKIKAELSISEKEDIGLSHRIEKLFERNLIQKDFKSFRTKKVDDGRVQSVNYSDEVGGNVKATSGGSYFNGKSDQNLDLQDSRVYFDIKESIYNDKELSSITVTWTNKSGFRDDRFDEIEVRYTCHRGFYITHFLKYGVREEIYNYVLPKFNEYKRKPLE
ncbi:hypothetical protein ACIMQ7_000979 [Enterococcus faecalis]|uniref:hypothetical protein n=1 Tax=Enterococcus faecalis TaxID=1351 RepID=UPI0019DDE399|nr:hypothetical protein [Enterococcus faecalis]EGO2727262.1 hypothetical protein [Enterococcus faecalis]EHB6415823.1 hypothetical protein [Enterococcus faecalis]EHG5940165.1 hypothetical protein [Enterococcus faecalis]EHZ2983921.1 hypothetical protein [Enterococcus faecalis]EKD5213657.1 hypothetical protein [Enterococcus faecalis]